MYILNGEYGVFLLLNVTIHSVVKCTVIILMVVLVVKFDIPMVVLVIDNGGMTSVAAAAWISVKMVFASVVAFAVSPNIIFYCLVTIRS